MRVHTSSKLEVIVDALLRVVREPLASPFTAETVVVPSRALGDWLGLRLAEKLGVWANARFVTIDTFLAELASRDGEDEGLDHDTFAWTIAALLPALCRDDEVFAPVAQYLETDRDATKRLALARKLAGTFERYVRHRPDLVLAWERGEVDAADETARWQSALWRAIVARLGDGHAARRAVELVDRLQSGALADLPERVLVFAPEALSGPTVDALEALARHTPVHVFLRVSTGHALTESLGTRSAQLTATLAARPSVTLHDLDAEAPAPPRRLTTTIHACHAPMREAEVLRDQILAALADDPTLEPRDVLVLCPDLETYAPVVDAAFGVPESERTFLPYRIVDHAEPRHLRVVSAFLALLDLVPSRLTATDVVDFLAREPVRAKFDLEESELDLVRRWVSACGIRWGEDEAHRVEVGQPALRANTWRFGLDRLVLGYAMGAEDRTLCGDCLPYDDIEGATSEALGGLVAFCEELFALRKTLAGAMPVATWKERLHDALARMLHASGLTEAQHRMVRGAIDRVAAAAAQAGFTEDVPLAVVKDALDAELTERASRLEAPAGGITFARFASSRCVPARVVALLGMNDGVVPRATRKGALDLLAAEARPGDPSPREEDRQTFLDALTCARDRVLVTYIGQSIATNADRPPSVLVSELLESLDDEARPNAVVHHPLHAFSPVYFGAGGDARLFSHAASLCAGAQAMLAPRVLSAPFVNEPLAPSDQPRTVTLDQLAKFFEHPVRAFMTTRLRVSFGSDVERLEDREPLELDALEAWKVGAALLARDERATEVPRDLVAEGVLPLGVVGASSYVEIAKKVAWIRERISEHVRGASFREPVHLELDVRGQATRVVGWVKGTTKDVHLVTTYSNVSGKHKVGAWVRHVALNAAGHALRTVLVCKDDVVQLAPMKPVDARAELRALVDLYWRGLEAPLLFFPETSIAYAERFRKNRDADDALVAAERAFEGDYGGAKCPYVARAFGGTEALDDAFEPFATPRDRSRFPSFSDLAVQIVGPMLAQSVQTKEAR